MKHPLPFSPAFGEATLSNCEREQIHLPGSIQPHGALVVLDAVDLRILQYSENLVDFLELDPKAQPVFGADLDSQLVERINGHMDRPLDEIPAKFRCHAGVNGRLFDCFLHRAGAQLVVEFLHSGSLHDLSKRVKLALHVIQRGKSLRETCSDAANVFRDLTGYDRVMVYRFDDEGHGQVFAESFEKDLEPYLGNRYPASDIPQIARRLYLQNRIRMLVDVGYTPVRIEPRLSPATGKELDMSLCFLRSISPVHTQYLKNMGVDATLVISIVVGGELWGLVACHHYSPHIIPNSVCAACEFLSESIAIRVAEYEAHAEAQADLSVRHFETHLSASLSNFGDWKSGLFDGSKYILRPMEAGGAAIFVDNEFYTTGEVPGTADLRAINAWLSEKADNDFFATASLGGENPEFARLAEAASGLVAVSVSQTPGERLMWFRPQQLRTDIWGGDPAKAIQMGDDPADLSPRRSFAKWYEEVEGTSVPWSSATLYVAGRLRESVSDAILHNRSVRALIAEDQLNKAVRQVGKSDLPVIITDASRRILLANEAFLDLLPPGVPHLDRVEDLPRLFAEPDRFRRGLTDLCDRQIAWRGEVSLLQGRGGNMDLILRGDVVQVPPKRVLGYLFMFLDMSEYKAVEDARRKFQEVIVSESDIIPRIEGSNHGLIQQSLYATVVGNAKNAALEISNGVDVSRIPEMLESVRRSVLRSGELLIALMEHDAEQQAQDDDVEQQAQDSDAELQEQDSPE